jgi:pimeloyl-ACP methyl ester carboxylesterase
MSQALESSFVVSPNFATIYNKQGLLYALTVDVPTDFQSNQESLRSPIILVHGIPGSDRDFKYLAPLIAKQFPCIRITLPGFGILAQQGPNVSTLKRRAKYLQRIAACEGWEKYVVLGHSMGGASALAWACHDTQVHALILLNSVGRSQHRGMAYNSMQTRWALYSTYLPYWGKKLIRYSQKMLKRSGFKGEPFDTHQIRLIYKYVIHLDFKQIQSYCNRVEQASLCIWSEDDILIETEISQDLANSIRNSRSIVYQTGGHNTQKTQAHALAYSVCEFYREVTRQPSS